MTKNRNDPERIDDILALLERVWKQDPSLRLGQLVSVALTLVGIESRVYNASDDELIEGLSRLLKLQEERKSRG